VVGVALVAVGAVLAALGVGGGMMAAGFLLWGAGDVLDATVDWAEGRTTGRELLVSAGLAVGLSLVGGGAAKLGANALRRLVRTGLTADAGGRLPQDMDLVKRIAAQAGVGLDGVKVRIHKSAPRQGMFGQTTPDGACTCTPMPSGTRRSWSRPTDTRQRPSARCTRTRRRRRRRSGGTTTG